MSRRAAWVLCIVLCSLRVSAAAQLPPAPLSAAMPKPLADWVPWVLAPDEQRSCPLRDDAALCFWPARLVLELDAHGGRFALDAAADRRLYVGLPGGHGSWPVALRVDAAPAVVFAQGEQPTLELQPGRHRVEGQFRWSQLPQRLPVPAAYGLIELSVNGQRLARPKRDEAGSLWLQHSVEPEQAAELELRVQRKFEDGVPLRVDTRLRVRAAGQPREIDLGSVLPAGAVPLSISSELPARLDALGRLQLQVRAGTFEVQLLARLPGQPERIENVTRPAPWPSEEAWAFEADEPLRQLELSGLRAVEPARLELPGEWASLPAFVAGQGEALVLKTVRRGDPDPVPDLLSLQRTLWLDQDGGGYSVRDHISGELHGPLRLELRGHALGRVTVAGRDQLVTQLTAASPSGVELRDRPLELEAEWRAARLPALAWSHDMQALAVELHLPPGYSLLGARGVDRVDSSWLQDWDLLGFFFVLLAALGTARIAGLGYGLVAFLALGLAYQEPDAPRSVWIVLLVLVALVRVASPGRLQGFLRVVLACVVLGFVAQALPFAARSLREAIYPQLGERTDYASPRLERQSSFTAVSGGGQAELRAPSSSAIVGMLKSSPAPAEPQPAAPTPARGWEDPEAIVQTGPGLPDWNWRRWNLSWSGPVQRDASFELWIVPPLINRTLAVLRVLLGAAFAYGLFRALGRARAERSTALLLLLLCFAPLLSNSARADFPDSALLQELHTRLTRPAECQPHCVKVSELRLGVSDAGLDLDAEVHAQAASSVRIAGPAAVWAPASVSLDGSPAPLLLHADGFLHVRVLPGVHRVRALGPLPQADRLTMRLGDAPARVTVQAQGYDVTGLREDGTADDALELERRLPASDSARALDQTAPLPAWLRVTRELDLGLAFQVHTTLERVTPRGSSLTVHLPLLENEAVNDARVHVQGRDASLTLEPDAESIRFESSLPVRDHLQLMAADGERYTETWKLRCGQLRRCTSTGITPTSRLDGDALVSTFRPWPGERLEIALQKPAPAQGQSTTVDSARFELQPGLRQTVATLSASIRTTRGGAHSVELPEGARVRSLSLDGAARPVHMTGRTLGFALQPGAAQLVLQLDLSRGMDSVFEVPVLRLDVPIANARVAVTPRADRWLLWLHGPDWGPAILFWGYLALALLSALILARLGGTPLRPYEWLLLAFGLTQIEPVEALFVVGFFFVFAMRGRQRDLPRWRHNLLQLGLVLVSICAAVALFDAVQHGLLVQPDMQVAPASAGPLEWYVDRTAGELPSATIVSAPLWVYRGLMLLWALWLASGLLRWLPWAFGAFIAGGAWRRRPRKVAPSPPSAAS